MLLLMVIEVLITKVMSNIALVPYWCLFQLYSVIAQGQPIGIYAIPLAIACSLSLRFPMADPTVAMAYGQVT